VERLERVRPTGVQHHGRGVEGAGRVVVVRARVEERHAVVVHLHRAGGDQLGERPTGGILERLAVRALEVLVQVDGDRRVRRPDDDRRPVVDGVRGHRGLHGRRRPAGLHDDGHHDHDRDDEDDRGHDAADDRAPPPLRTGTCRGLDRTLLLDATTGRRALGPDLVVFSGH
jgi:hypothetical protein